ncbi:hypothetical protein OJ997_33665 [Solirubrobacter phytolaccae]|uniref:Uncharacterized protein n=1 Tax=Solirubrobacter phytolaccae TaxID=1404360 RepID=A0A9X3NHQ9_9ACTN|nr:hypothetical protein [Solirubrobacter phytolaccae]MDA0185302.1 hypothetical protein [Solirubrobacter phytolaccae]
MTSSPYRNVALSAAVLICFSLCAASLSLSLLTARSYADSDPVLPVAAPGVVTLAQTPTTTFQVLHDDHIGTYAIPAGYYTLTPFGGMNATQATQRFARFLQDFDGKLPKPWQLNAATASFARTDTGAGFAITPTAPPVTPTPAPANPTGTVCAGVFEVEHNDRIGTLAFPAGDYVITSVRGTCAANMSAFKRLLARNDSRVPSPWTLNAQTGTFGTGAGARFRVKPAA